MQTMRRLMIDGRPLEITSDRDAGIVSLQVGPRSQPIHLRPEEVHEVIEALTDAHGEL